MAEIAAKVLVVGGGPGGYVCGHPRRPARPRCRAGRAGRPRGRAGRHLPQCRLHPVEGDHPCRRRLRTTRAEQATVARRSASGSSGRRIDFARTIEWKDGIVGRLTSGVGALLKRHKVKIVHGHADDGRRQDLPGRDRHRSRRPCAPSMSCSPPARSRRALPVAAVRRPGHLLDRGAVAAGGPRAAGRGRRRLYRARARHRLRQARRRRSRSSRRRTASCRPTTTELTRPVARRLQALGVEVLTRRAGRPACPTRAMRSGSRSRARRGARASRPTRSSSPPAGAPGPRASASTGSTSR